MTDRLDFSVFQLAFLFVVFHVIIANIVSIQKWNMEENSICFVAQHVHVFHGFE